MRRGLQHLFSGRGKQSIPRTGSQECTHGKYAHTCQMEGYFGSACADFVGMDLAMVAEYVIRSHVRGDFQPEMHASRFRREWLQITYRGRRGRLLPLQHPNFQVGSHPNRDEVLAMLDTELSRKISHWKGSYSTCSR